MMKVCASLIAVVVRCNVRRCGRLNAHRRLTAFALASFCIASVARAQPSWTGATSADWNVGTNWTPAGAPGAGATVKFDQNSVGNLSTNNNISGLTLAGIVNTSNGTTGPTIGGVATPVSISGNPLTVGATGILMGGSLTVGFTSAAKVNMSINTDLTLSANQFWQAGGVGPTLTIGASPANTVTLNGNTPTIKNISQSLDLMVINSSLVDGSAASSVIFDRSGTATINAKMRMRINGNSTYTGGTTINEHKQVLQIGSSSTGTSGPFGTGPITLNAGSALTYFQPIDADRTINNDITLNGQLTTTTWRPIGAAAGTGDPKHSLTLTGTLTSAGNANISTENGDAESTGVSDGSGDLIINGNVMMTSSGASTLTTGAVGNGSPTRQSGKVIYNGNILQTNSGASITLTVANGNDTFPATVQLNGQNTYINTTLSAAGAATATTDANIQIGSDSILNDAGFIVSGPLGRGNVSVTNVGNTPRIEAVNGPHTVANPVILTSSAIFQGTQDLTLTGGISGNTAGSSGLTKNGTGKLILAGTNDNSYTGQTSVLGGKLLVNSTITSSSSVTVGANGTLGGTGTITSNITNNGILAPGASVGTLSVTGNVTDGANSSWSIELSGATSDLLAVTGDINLSAVDALNVTGAGTGTSWLIGTYTGNLTGAFDTVTPGYSVTYTGGSITLNAAAVSLPGDFNSDGKVDAGDYATWRKNETTNAALANDNGVGNQAARFALWRANFGNPPGSGSGALAGAAVPEPATMFLLLIGVMAGLAARGRRSS